MGNTRNNENLSKKENYMFSSVKKKSLRIWIKNLLSFGIKFKASDSRPKTSNFELPSSVFGLPTSVSGLRSLNSKQQTPDFGLPSSSPKLRITAIFLILTILLPTITPYGNVLANNNGPNAPEAASFEPVDATDMVNLLTGDFTYVLPLMNVPSPEGGYPIALSYHAGIAMDQEASWVGLGWNLNPGAINRSVNGYPDDYNRTLLSEYLYDEGREDEFYSITLGYSLGVSVGVGVSWGSNQSLGGHVSVGVGISDVVGVSGSVGTSGASVGVNIGISDVLSLGVNVNTNGDVGTSIGFDFDKNGTGFSIGASTDGSYSLAFTAGDDSGNKTSLGVNISSQGVGYSLSISQKTKVGGKNLRSSGGIGIGANRNFSNTISQGDYTVNHSASTIPIILPIPGGGILSLSFGKQKVKYFAANRTDNIVYGPLNFHKPLKDGNTYSIFCWIKNTDKRYYDMAFSEEEKDEKIHNYKRDECSSCNCNASIINVDSFMDIYEVPLDDNYSFSDRYNILNNNPVFPSYDKYNVQAQGLGGSIHAKLNESGNLYGLSNRKMPWDAEVKYALNGDEREDMPSYFKFYRRPVFSFDNEVKTYLNSGNVLFDAAQTAVNFEKIEDIYDFKTGSTGNSTIKASNHVAYYTNKEILDSNSNGTDIGLISSNNIGFDRSTAPSDGIGAFAITAPDGKTYHYTLPVYNHETITRTYGMSPFHEGAGEFKAYFEKRQLEPYATHWLLTAVTGPDYIDGGNGVADEGDLGYWVSFEYGLWSDNYVWKWPYGKDYLQDPENPDIKTWTKGRKQQYFINKIKTRTHTALFLKNEREDNRSPYWRYQSVEHLQGKSQSGHDYHERFVIPEHKTLRLDKVILVKNENDISNLDVVNHTPSSVEISYPNSNKEDVVSFYNLKNNVFDWSDNWQAIKDNAIKVICLDYKTTTNSLVRGTPGTGSEDEGRLTLDAVRFGGKQDATIMPPYRFGYINDDNYRYNANHANEWGYKYDDPAMWSLDEIVTPQGGKIQVEYEQHDFRTISDQEFSVTNKDEYSLDFELDSSYNLQVGDDVYVYMNYHHAYNQTLGHPVPQYSLERRRYNGGAIISQINPVEGSKVSVLVSLEEDVETTQLGVRVGFIEQNEDIKDITAHFDIDASVIHREGGGIRTKSVSVISDLVASKSNYKYGEHKDGIGWVSYIPSAPDVQKEVPYSTELPAPRPLYEYSTHEIVNPINDEVYQETVYQYHVMKEKGTSGGVRFGNLYSLDVLQDEVSDKETVTQDENVRREIYKNLKISTYEIKDNLNCVGQLLSVTSKNKEGQILNKITNTYYEPEELPNRLGTFSESYQSYKFSHDTDTDIVFNGIQPDITVKTDVNWMVNNSRRVKYPNLLKSSTEVKNGISYTTEFNNFDPISGQAKEVHSYSSNSLEMKSVSEPAFRKYPSMGSKADDITNKNMLSQGASTYSYFRDSPTDSWKLYDAEIQTWKDWGSNIWRKHENYVWKGDLNQDGSYVFNASSDKFKFPLDFNKFDNLQSESWQKISEIKRYSDWSRALETEDINGNRASNLMCDNYSKVLAVCNAPYNKMLNMNFDNSANLPHSVSLNGSHSTAVSYSSIHAHSGAKSLRIEPNASLGINLSEPDSYKISMWVHTSGFNNISVLKDNSPIQYNSKEIVYAGDWIQLNYYTSTSSAVNLNITSAGSGGVNDADLLYIDDLRIYPIESSMTSYVYNEWDELISILGANNMGTKFEYDAAGRLIKTFTEVQNVDVDGSTIGGFVPATETRQFYKNQ